MWQILKAGQSMILIKNTNVQTLLIILVFIQLYDYVHNHLKLFKMI